MLILAVDNTKADYENLDFPGINDPADDLPPHLQPNAEMKAIFKQNCIDMGVWV